MVENNDSCIYSLDDELSASVKKILLQRIEFKDAKVPDEGDKLYHKYKPLNARYNAQHANTLKLNNQNMKMQVVPCDMPKAPTIIFPVEKVELEWKDIRRIGPGLANLGNTCFLNSVLQVLTYTPPLVNYILSDYHKNKCRTVGFCMQCELTAHFNRVLRHNTQMGAIRPMSIIQKLQCIGKNFRFGRQEDAHEFLRYVVEGIQKSDYADRPKLDKLSRETTVANAIFGGFYRSQVKCLHCHYESNTFDPMMDLNLDIKDCSSIIQTLQKSVRPDRLDGENKYFCEKCRCKRVAQKRGNIHKEPNVLTLQLKRFDFTKMFGGKICKDVSFPEELNIRPFMSNNQGDPVIYKLYSILVHSGYSCNSGHYYCYVKAQNGTWYEMNDNRVCQVGLQAVLRAQAYLLFYVKRKPPNSSVTKYGIPKSASQRPEPIKSTLQRPEPLKGILQKTEPLKGAAQRQETLKSRLQRPEEKTCSLSDLDKHRLSGSKNPLGVLLKRKSEPKINWTNNGKEKLPGGKPQSIPCIPSGKISVNESSMDVNEEKSVYPVREKVVKLPVSHTHTHEKDSKKESNLNALEKLNESYGDSDEVDSRASSPTEKKMVAELQSNDMAEDINKLQCVQNSIVDAVHPDKPVEKECKAPFKLKLKNGKQFIHNKLNIWSPLTKGTLYPRAILNKCVLDNETDQSKNNLSAKKKKLSDTSWKEEKLAQSEKMFGPLMPPPPGTKCTKESNSITSEASSTGSIQTQSGEWDVLDKGCEGCPPLAPDRQHAGWNICPTSKNASIISTNPSDENEIPNEIDDDSKSKKKKKKKKKKRKHRSEEFITGHIELKQRVCISIDKPTPRKESSSHCSEDDFEDRERYGSKKKKRGIKENIELQSTISLPTEDILHKKKKKKHKRKYSLLIDTNSNTFNIPCSIEHSPKFKVKSKVLAKSDYSSSFPKSPSFHRNIVENEGTLYENSMDARKVDTSISSTVDKKSLQKPSETCDMSSRKNSCDNSNEKSDIYNSKKVHSHFIRRDNLPYNNQHDNERLDDRTSNLCNSESNSNINYSIPSVLKHCENNSNLHYENIDSFEKSTNKGSSSYSSPLKREGSTKSVDAVRKDEARSERKKEVPTHTWDDSKKKNCSWDGSNKSSDTVEYLLNGISKVKSWDGSDKSYLYNTQKHVSGEHAQDEWDEEYDKGKVKKRRKFSDDREYHQTKSNSFQDFQNSRNQNPKEKYVQRHGKHQNGDRHHSKKRKLYSGNDKFL